MRDKELPTIDKCDLSNPEEVFLWTYLGLPDVIGAPLVWPVPFWRKVSAHQIDCGLMLQCPNCGHREPPKKKYRIDATEDPMMGGGGRWVPADEPDPEQDVIDEALSKVRKDIRRKMFDRLREEFPEDPALHDGGGS